MSVAINEIYNEDCKDLMDRMDADSVDLIVTDPPFGVNFQSNIKVYNRKQENVLKGYAEVSKLNYRSFSLDWIGRAKKVLKETGSMYVVSGTTNLADVLHALAKHEFKIINHIIWHYNFGVYTKNKFVASHYHILYVATNPLKVEFNTFARFPEHEKKESYQDRQDVWFIKREFWKDCYKSPTKLPKELVEKIIEYSSSKDQLVFDPFAGSGQVPFVAKKLGRNYLGCEIMTDVQQFSKKRLDTDQYLIKIEKQK